MPEQLLAIHSSRFSVWRLPLLVGTCSIVAALQFIAPQQSASFRQLYPLLVLVAASFYGKVGGIIVGLLAGWFASPFSPFITATPLTNISYVETFLRACALLAIGLLAGFWVDAYREQRRQHDQLIDESIQALLRVLDSVDPGTARHSERVTSYAIAIAEQLSLPEPQVERVRRAAMLHDIGKLSIPPEVLNKPGPLSDDEWAMIKRHPVEAVRIIGEVTGLKPVLAAVRHHHERLDGRGYPDGVQGERSPLEARIISVADAFDAMTSQRAYRPPLSTTEAYAELRRHAGTQFDPQVVEAFIRFHETTKSTPRRSCQTEPIGNTL